MRRLLAAVALVALAGACGFLVGRGRGADAGPGPADRPIAADGAAGARIVAERNCNFCHLPEPGQPVVHPAANCQDCHRREGLADFVAPSLSSIGARRPTEWLRRYLRHPYPIRTGQPGRMPDLALGDGEVEALVVHIEDLAADRIALLEDDGIEREADPDLARLGRGRRLFEDKGCALCHALGPSRPADSISPEARLAPDLTEVWRRVRPGWLARAIGRPSTWLPGMAMPDDPRLTDGEAELLAWYVTNAIASRPPSVGYLVVGRILERRCLACHYGPLDDPPPSANPEGGAGWLGFFGRPARRLDLTTYEGLMAGSIDDLGRRRAVVVPGAINSPILAHLRGQRAPSMPFGLPPLPAAEIDAIERWILEGARGPTAENGLLVHPPIEVR